MRIYGPLAIIYNYENLFSRFKRQESIPEMTEGEETKQAKAYLRQGNLIDRIVERTLSNGWSFGFLK